MSDLVRDEIEAIWEEDKLSRQQEAEHLIRFLKSKFSHEKGAPFVLNLDSNWGHGKTFFITRLASQLRHCGYPVVVFDAWKNDFSDEALLSFISAVCSSLDTELNGQPIKNEVSKLKGFAASLIKPALPILLAALVKQLTGMSAHQLIASSDSESPPDMDDKKIEHLEDISSQLTSLAASKALEMYSKKKNATEGFIKSIEKIVEITEKSKAKNGKQLPIFIFVDELDRCRPSFSIELLEGIKHLFSAAGVYFIVSTNTEQLCHSIKAVYGSEFDAKQYLKRFFNMEYQLETPPTSHLANYLFSKSSIQESFFIPKTIKDWVPVEQCFSDICDFFKLGARDVEQVFETIKTSAYLTDMRLHLIYLMLITCMNHKYHGHSILAQQPMQQSELKDFLDNEITQGKLNEAAEYNDFDGTKTVSINIKDLFDTYLFLDEKNLKDQRGRLSSARKEIARQLIIDNDPRASNYLEGVSIDKTLLKYYGLVTRAGNFTGKLDAMTDKS